MFFLDDTRLMTNLKLSNLQIVLLSKAYRCMSQANRNPLLSFYNFHEVYFLACPRLHRVFVNNYVSSTALCCNNRNCYGKKCAVELVSIKQDLLITLWNIINASAYIVIGSLRVCLNITFSWLQSVWKISAAHVIKYNLVLIFPL